MTLFYLFDLFLTEKFSHPQILARPVGHLCLSSYSSSKKEIFIIKLPTSMAFSKNIQASTIATSIRLGTTTTNNCIGAINCSQPKACNQLQAQSTKETEVQTIISLDPLIRNKVINKDISTLEHLKYGANPLLPSQEVGRTNSLPSKGTQKMRFHVLTSNHFLLHHLGKLCQS